MVDRRHLMGVDIADSELYRKHADDLTRFATVLLAPRMPPMSFQKLS